MTHVLSFLCTLLLSISLVLPSVAAEMDTQTLLTNGMELYKSGNLARASQLFEQATVQSPDNILAWYNLGAIEFELKHYEKARNSFQKAVWRNPSDTDARISLALSQEALGMNAEAINNLNRIPAGTPRFNEAQQKLAVLQRDMAKINTTVATNKTSPQRIATQPSVPAVAAVATTANTAATNAQRQVVLTTALSGPTGIAMGPSGEIYIANYSKNSIVMLDSKGKTTNVAVGNELLGPIGLVRDARNGNLYVANYLKGNIIRVKPTGQMQEVASGFGKPYYLLLDSVHNTLYVTEQEGNLVSKVRL